MLYSKFTYSKNFIILLLLIFSSQINVTAQVGIGTTEPSQSLHIAGSTSTIRVEGLSSTNNNYNNGSTESVVHVNSNGDFVLKPQYPLNLVSLIGSNFINPPANIVTNDGGPVNTIIANGSFTTSKNGMVNVEYAVGANQIKMPDSTIITDGAPRLVVVKLYIDGVYISRDSKTYTNHQTGTVVVGTLTLSASNMINLASGPHTYAIQAKVFGGEYPFQAEFGGSSNLHRFSVIEL